VRRPAAAVLAALLVLAAACGGDDSSSGPTSTAARATSSTSARSGSAATSGGPDACDLLTPAQLEAALHRPFGEGAPAAAPAYGSGCTWGTSSGDPALYLSLVVATDDQLDAALGRPARQLFEQTRDAAAVDEQLDLGDAAYRSGPQVVVLDGGVLLSLAVTDPSPASLAGMEALAGDAVDALHR
jgi:hypothetical protein